MSIFDPTKLLDDTTNQALTKRPPLTPGDYLGTIGEPQMQTWQSNKPDAKVKAGVKINLPIEIEKAANPDMSSYPQDKVTLVPGIMLDLTEGGLIDWSQGKNGSLRRYREALGMNNPGESFSVRQMQGRQIRVRVKHREYEGEFYDEVESPVKV
jgi:hypothetical protein